jgi:hypothetical protein
MKIDSSHNMRRISDVPWVCTTCMACECHNIEVLVQPCKTTVEIVTIDTVVCQEKFEELRDIYTNSLQAPKD